MMVEAIAHVPTRNAGKYVMQLCKHWAHKLDVSLDGETGVVHFPEAVATMAGLEEELAVCIQAKDEETLERMKQVVASHLDRFAFREAPLAFSWEKVER